MLKKLHLEWGLFLLTVAASVLFLAGLPHAVVFDQNFITYSFQWSTYPSYDSGIVSNLIVGFYNRLIHPSAETVDLHIRLLAMLMFSFSAFLLARKVLKTSLAQILFVFFLFTSRYYFLWLSSELFVGAFLCLSLYACLRALDGEKTFDVWAGLALAGAALTKPDIWLISLVIFFLVLHAVKDPARRKVLFGTYGGAILVVALPGLLIHGWGTFFGNRSYSAFGQHYSALIAGHQLASPIPEPWGNWNFYMERLFPGASNLFDVIWKFPTRYCDFVFLSLSESFKDVLFLFGPLVVLVPLLHFWKPRGAPLEKESASFIRLSKATLIGLIPIIAMAYLHVRYMARYYPLGVLCALLALDRPAGSTVRRTVISIVIFAGLIWNVIALCNDVTGGLLARVYWFPD